MRKESMSKIQKVKTNEVKIVGILEKIVEMHRFKQICFFILYIQNGWNY